MKRRTGLTLLLACLVLVPLSHLDVQSPDGRWLLQIDGRPVDLAGHLQHRWNRLVRDCQAVESVPASDPLHAQALQTVRHYSPPDSESARLRSLIRSRDWAIAELAFERLPNAVVLIRNTAAGPGIAPQGVWSGSTHPYRYDTFVRDYLLRQVPQAPADLIRCLDPLP